MPLQRVFAAVFLCFSITAFLPSLAVAQQSGSSILERSYVNTYARPGQVTQTVFIWGSVRTPGIWRIERGTNLVELLSAVQFTADPARSVIEVRVHRVQEGSRQLVYTARHDEILKADPSTFPAFQENDVIEIHTKNRRRITFKSVTSFLGTAASLTLLTLRIISASNR